MLTSLGKSSLVVDNGNVLFGQVGDGPVLDLPKVIGDLRDESWAVSSDSTMVYVLSLRKSCETITTPPSNSLMAAASESIDS